MVKLSSTAAISKGMFRVKIEGVPEISFNAAEGIAMENEIGEYRDGTEQETTNKVGNTIYEDLTLRGGESLASLQPLWQWATQIMNAKENGGLTGEELERLCDVIVENEAGETVMTWRHEGCLVKRVEADSRDGTSSDVAVATLVLKVTRRYPVFGDAPG